MVKGVNKTVIEVQATGNRLFEKIVFYVSPEYGNVSARRLKKAAGDFSKQFCETPTVPLRRRVRRRRFVRAAVLAGIAVTAAAVAVFLLLGANFVNKA